MVPGAADTILRQLDALGMYTQNPILYQSARLSHYQSAFDRLLSLNLVYPCGCTRKEIADSVLRLEGHLPEGERPYPGTCRQGLPEGRQALSWRLRAPKGVVRFTDRWLGPMEQDVARAVGDFVLRRADGIWAYQLAVVVDDAAQNITHIVRGEDLLSSTARQHQLAILLDYDVPQVLHVPLVTDESGLKLSKQNRASPVNLENPLQTLQKAWIALGFDRLDAQNVPEFWEKATCVWAERLSRANLHGTH